MTTAEAFKELSSHMIKGLMFHEQMTDYFSFLNLHGYEACHEYHAILERAGYRRLHRFYMETYGRLIDEGKPEDPAVIPATWYRYSREEVDTKTKRQAVRESIEKWVQWEGDTRNIAMNISRELEKAGDEVAARYVLDIAEDAAKELRWAKKTHINLASVDYDMVYILDQQDYLHDWYRKAIKKACRS